MQITCRFKNPSNCIFRLFQPGPGFSGGVKTQPESRCPELLANFCDMLLRKTPLSKKLTSDEIESKLKDVVCIYCTSSVSLFKLNCIFL